MATELIGQLPVTIKAQISVLSAGLPCQLVLGVILVVNAG